MKQLITIALLLCSTWAWAQTVTTPPSGSKGYGTPVATPSGEILVGRSGSYTYVTRKAYTDSLIALGWKKEQVDSAINAQIALISFPVTSVNGETGAVMLDAADIGLGNVDNTSDLNKPISTATQSALDGKENTFSKNTAFNKNFGTTAGTVAQGNDARIVNGQTAYSWGDWNAAGLWVNGISGTWNSAETGGVFRTIASASDAPTGLSYYGAYFPSGEAGYGTYVAGRNNRYFMRSLENSVLQPWNELYHSGNFTPPVVFTRSVNGLVPAPGGSGTTRFLAEDMTWRVPTGGGGGSTPTDLSIQNRTSTTLQVGSSTGSAATIPVVTTSLGGLMTASDKVKLNGVPNDFSVYVLKSGDVMTGNLTVPSTRIDTHLQTSKDVDGYRIQVNSTGYASYNKLYLGRSDGTTSVVTGDGLTFWHAGNLNPANFLTTSYVPAWASISGKPTTFTPSPHSHSANDINSGVLAISRFPVGTTSGTVAAGNDSRIVNAMQKSWTVSAGDGLNGGGSGAANVAFGVDGTVVRTSRTINGKALSSNVTLTASDVSAIPISGNATVAGTKTFSSPVVVANATASNHAVTLGQMNAAVREIIKVDSGLVITLPGPTFSAGGTWQQTVIVPGASIGDVVAVSKSGSGWSAGSGLIATGYVYANNSVAVDIVNAGSVSFSVVPLTVQIVVIK